MKKLMMIAAMMIAAVSANAQNEVGQVTLKPTVGVNFANMTADDAEMKVGLAAGVEAEYGVSDALTLSAGLLYSMEGCKVEGTDLKLNLDYINIPILANYYVSKGFAIKAGIQPALNVRHKLSNGDNDADVSNVKSLILSVPVGVSYEFNSFVLDARYNFGITDMAKEGNAGKNSTISITLGYKFSL